MHHALKITSPQKQADRLAAVQQLLLHKVIDLVLNKERFQGFNSNLFTIPRPSGRVWLILDLKTLNACMIALVLLVAAFEAVPYT